MSEPKWEPFQQGSLPDTTVEEIMMRAPCTREEAEKILAGWKDEIVFLNNLFQVNVRKGSFPGVPCPMLHLSIKRLDKEPIRDWRHFQRIKNEIVGPENEAVELFPAESRLVDGANQYHLWVLTDPKMHFPFGFEDGRMVRNDAPVGGKQRPYPEGA